MGILNHKFMMVLIVVIISGLTVWADDTEISDNVHALMGAAFHGRLEQVQRLLDKGVDVNSRYLDYETPLIFASLRGHVKIVKLLLSRGADVNARDEWGKTALTYAEEKGHKQVRDLLIKHGARK